ncbi:hypothetical protein WH50_24210 [Pokkaliibacter plantistimulans]|uniref:Cytochrome B561 n=1 Tax=Pokkaliibacter plantistimulans TaxID=1635171 RepID=A0ABX5LTF1_9GAMM|nr:COX15/CtaA family protein [Pokkaliibacter plantistimulans]PXF28793.1 hypothetical protein WH50_24210 [Pokkaliibacter plantistimulans]
MTAKQVIPYRACWLAVVLASIVVALGAYTRLSDAGLGCPDWPGCYGFAIVPHSYEHMVLAAERFPGVPVESAKGWAEMVHRYAAGGLGVLICYLAAVGLSRNDPRYPRWHSLMLLCMVLLQAMFGMWTVTLKLWPQVVTMHLLGGISLLTLLFLLLLRLRTLMHVRTALSAQVASPLLESDISLRWLRGLAWAALFMLIFQVALGGWTSSNYAAMACPDFPTCQQQWWPATMDIGHGMNVLQHVGPNYLGGQLTGPGRVAIHVLHRVGALLVSGGVIVLVVLLWRARVQAMAVTLGAMLVMQVCLGVANVFWQFPIFLALAHNTGAALLMLTLVSVLYHLYRLRQL